MKVIPLCAAAMLATGLAASPTLAADTAASTGAGTNGQKTADKDFGRLSADGVKAFRDVQAARLALFNGEPDRAKTYLADAQAALNRATNDDTVFTKAESELKMAPGDKQPVGATNGQSTTKVAWLPVDGEMAVDEDYVDASGKNAGMTKANPHQDEGASSTAGASSNDGATSNEGANATGHANANHADPLKLADLDVDFTAEVIPLRATISQVDKAAQLADQNHFYEAGLALKTVEDSARFDTVVVNATPAKSGGTSHS